MALKAPGFSTLDTYQMKTRFQFLLFQMQLVPVQVESQLIHMALKAPGFSTLDT
jgi:hypothetical protein